MKVLFNPHAPYGVCDMEYDQVHSITSAIVAAMKKDGICPTKIIAPIRGGLLPAVIASHQFNNVPVLPVDYSSYKGKGDNRDHSNNLLRDLFDKFDTDDTLLMIDDIIDSGFTFQEIIETVTSGEFISGYGEIVTASLCLRPYSVFQPDYVGHLLSQDAGFVNFPWEV